MKPVVNGLEQEFGGQVTFQRLNMAEADARAAFDQYALRGHPSYVLLDGSGSLVWTGVGPIPRETLRDLLSDAVRE